MTKLRFRFFYHFYNFEYLSSIHIPCQTSANISSGSGEEVDFAIFVSFRPSNGDHLGYST